MEIGAGQHGEGGGVRVPMKSSKETVATVAEALCRNLELKAGDRAFVMINGCGATTMMEMLVLFKDTVEFLKERGVEVAAACPVPIVIAGGKKLPELEALEMAYRAIQEGAHGVDMGRNIFQSDCPAGMAQAIGKVVHEGYTPKQAFEVYETVKNQ